MNTAQLNRIARAPTPQGPPAPARDSSSIPPGHPEVFPRAVRERPRRRRLARRSLLAAALLITLPSAAWGWLFRGWESEQSAIALLKPIDLSSRPIFGTRVQNDLGRDGWILDRACAIQPAPAATDPDLAPLTSLHHLASIDLDFTQVTDAGLVYLKNLRRLQRLDLAGTRITNTGLASLQNLTQLRELDLESTGVTPAGIAMLQSKLPDCRIYH